MIVLRYLLALMCATAAMAQTEQAKDVARVTGVVRDAASGSPLAGATIYVDRSSRDGKQISADSQGRFKAADLSPGSHTLTAEAPRAQNTIPAYASRRVTVAAGQDVAGLDFLLVGRSEISGRVADQNNEPVSGATLTLVAREYSLGALRYVYADRTQTDDQGKYTLKRVAPGRAYLLMAERKERKMKAISDAPVDPKLRKPAVVSTYYPGASTIEGAQPITLRVGERREGVDLKMLRSASYCVEGVLAGPDGPGAVAFTFSGLHPTSGYHGDGGMFAAEPAGQTGEDGKVRLCDLPAGDYRLTVHSTLAGLPQFYGSAQVTVVDRDVRNVTVVARPRMRITGEVLAEGDPPATGSFRFALSPLTRAFWGGEHSDVRTTIPGQFVLADVLFDSYWIRLFGLPATAYVKEASYAGRNILVESFEPGTAVGDASIRIVLASDGATVEARVLDKDGNGVGDARVLLMPVSSASEAALAAAIVSGQCDQRGQWKSNSLAPGKYYALALKTAHDNSPETIGKIWARRTHMQEVELVGKRTLALTLSAVDLD
jgi:protocatechuate 3,4-dioxygenase beta subunit